jgi:hypothetical protein
VYLLFPAMPELLRSGKLAVEKGQAQGRDDAYVKQLVDFIIPPLVEAMHKEPETEICSSMLDALNECIQACYSHFLYEIPPANWNSCVIGLCYISIQYVQSFAVLVLCLFVTSIALNQFSVRL